MTPDAPLVDLFSSGLSTFPWSAGQRACYRIPSLLRLNNGTLLALVSERLVGPKGGCGDESPSNIILRRSDNDGATWGSAALVMAAGPRNLERSAWAIEDAQSGTIFAFSNANVNSTVGCSCEVDVTSSSDRGRSWSVPRTLPPSTGVYGSGLASGFTHRQSGRLIGCMRKICRNSCPADYRSKAFYSDDRGASWTASSWLASGTTECQIAELSDGRLCAPPTPLPTSSQAPARH